MGELTGKQPQLPNKSTYPIATMVPAPPAPAKTSIPLQRSSLFTLPDQSCTAPSPRAHWEAATAPTYPHLTMLPALLPQRKPAFRCRGPRFSHSQTNPAQDLVRELTGKQPQLPKQSTYPHLTSCPTGEQPQLSNQLQKNSEPTMKKITAGWPHPLNLAVTQSLSQVATEHVKGAGGRGR